MRWQPARQRRCQFRQARLRTCGQRVLHGLYLRQQTGGIGSPPDKQFHRPVRHRRALLSTGGIGILFQSSVKIGAAKAKGTDPGTAWPIASAQPGARRAADG